MKFIIILLVFLLSYMNDFNSYPKRIIIYKLDQYSSYPIGVNSRTIKRLNPEIRTITMKKEIKEFRKLFNDLSNFRVDTTIRSIDLRVLIEFETEGKVVKSIGWARVSEGRLQLDEGKIYFYTKKVENFLLKKKLIVGVKK